MSMRKLKKVIRKNWGIRYKTINKDTPLITLSEQIAMESEKCSKEEVYQMYIDNPSLHLPGLISFYIIDEMGFNPRKVNASMTISEILLSEKYKK